MIFKKLIFFSIAFVFLLTFNINATIDDSNNWIKMGGNNSNSKIINSNTIESKYDVGKRISVVGSFKDAIIIEDKIYVMNEKPIGAQIGEVALEKYNLNGIKEDSIIFEGKLGYFSRMTYDGNNTIFIGMKNYIQAIDITSKNKLWSTKPCDCQFLSQLVYHDGFVYAGMVTKPTTPSEGFYFAIDTSKDTNINSDVLEYAWTWDDNKQTTDGFYWDGAVIVENNIIFAGDNGSLVASDLKTGHVNDTYSLGAIETNMVRSLIHYDELNKLLYIGTSNTKKIYKIKFENNKFDVGSVQVLDNKHSISGGMNKSSKNNLYVSTGGMLKKAFSVYNDKLETIYQTTSYGSQSFPLINEKTSEYELVYFIDYDNGDLIILKNDGINTPTIERVILPEKGESHPYNSASVLAASDGSLVITKNDGGNLFIIKNKNSEGLSEVDKLNVDIKNVIYKNISVNDYSVLIELKNRYLKLSVLDRKKIVEYSELINKLNSLNNTTISEKIENKTYYYKFKIDTGKWFNYKTITQTYKDKVKKKITSVYTYSKDKMTSYYKKPLNGSIINKNNVILTKLNNIIKRDNKNYNSNGKILNRIEISYYKSKITKRVEKTYNKIQQLKSNKYGNAYQYITYYKNGKPTKTIRKKYNSLGKLSKTSIEVKLRKSY